MTINNNVSMTNDLKEDRFHFDVFIRSFRRQYQQLLMIATSTFDANLRFRFRTFVGKTDKNFNFIVMFATSATVI